MAPEEIVRVVFALAVVIALIGGGAGLAKRFGLANAGAGLVRKRRLALVETLAIDAKRRAAIIRCDDREHLVVLNPNSATVVARDLVGDAPQSDGEHADAAPDAGDAAEDAVNVGANPKAAA